MDQFNVRANGGTRIYTNAAATAGVDLATGATAWTVLSDSTFKRNIRTVDGDEMLTKLMQLPIKQWSLKSQDPSIEHIGPMAQDFYEVFGVGASDTRISTIDPPGIALAAIQGLNSVVQQQNVTIRTHELKIRDQARALRRQSNEIDRLDQEMVEVEKLRDELRKIRELVEYLVDRVEGQGMVEYSSGSQASPLMKAIPIKRADLN